MKDKAGGHTYSGAGVDISLEELGVKTLVSQLTYRRSGRFQMCSDLGHFAGLIEFGEHVLALAVDGVGTKMLIADRLENWSTLGIDCIAMNVNDLYVMNIEPVAFVDYIATDKIEPEKMKQIGVGLNEGARLSNINLIGGETATLKGLVNGLDLAGTCLGVGKKNEIITGSAIKEGDIIVGIPSSGIHSNGLTLARKIVESYSDYTEMIPGGKTLGEELLTPTRIYSEVPEVTRNCEVHGMCHITGGGLNNLKRLGAFGFDISEPLILPPVFRWIEETGNVEKHEMYKTFNMGMGYVFIAPEEEAEKISGIISDAKVVGTINEREGIRLEGENFI